jgi:YesN/AraC family two-component response regulator
MASFNVLIVEDNLTFRRALAQILQSQFPDIAIAEAGNGVEAIEKIHVFDPDVVFMDVRLPGENGLEITRKIKLQRPEIVVMILTSYDLPEYRDVAMHHGANHFIVKGSSTFEEISLLIKSYAAKRTAPYSA